ncbi:MAG: hypothetical protein V1847_02600 [Candidatus Diapherotrites archaeon]
MPHDRPSQQKPAQRDVFQDIKSLNSSILVLGQKIQYIARNEKILARNLIVLNKKIEGMQSGGVTSSPVQNSNDSSELSEKVAELEKQLRDLKENIPTLEEFNKLKYMMDALELPTKKKK